MREGLLASSVSLLCKLASIAVHADEMLSPDWHHLDREALASLLADEEVTRWVNDMTKLALAPKKRAEAPSKESE